MLLAIVLGCAAGVVGFLPLALALRLTKRTTHGGTAASMTVLLLGLLVSFLLLFAFAVLFFNFDREHGIPFLFVEVLALCISAVAFTLWKSLKR